MTETETEIVKIIELGKIFPNNQDFGKNFRSLYRSKEIVKTTPNDFDLGIKIRSIINEVNESNDLLEKIKNLEIRLGGLKND